MDFGHQESKRRKFLTRRLSNTYDRTNYEVSLKSHPEFRGMYSPKSKSFIFCESERELGRASHHQSTASRPPYTHDATRIFTRYERYVSSGVLNLCNIAYDQMRLQNRPSHLDLPIHTQDDYTHLGTPYRPRFQPRVALGTNNKALTSNLQKTHQKKP